MANGGGENLGKYWKDISIFTPSLQQNYAADARLTRRDFRGGNSSTNMSPRDLDFLNGNSKFWSSNVALYSVGHFNTALIQKPDMVSERNEEKTIVIGDSGGYQIGTGTLHNIDQFKDYKDANSLIAAWHNAEYKDRIVRWLDTYTDYAMTLDMPLWLKGNPSNPFDKLSFKELTDMSADNLRYIERHSGKTGKQAKWLNVLQGMNDQSAKYWFDSVKFFSSHGWAFASVGASWGNVLERVKFLQDEGQLDGKEWLHLLGASTLPFSALTTIVQKGLRETVSEKITISYDSSSASMAGGKFNEYYEPTDLTPTDGWTFQPIKFPIAEKYTDRKTLYPFPTKSPLDQYITLNDISVLPGSTNRSKTDKWSGHLITCHNNWVMTKKLQEAGRLAISTDPKDQKRLPLKLKEALDVTYEIVKTDDWKPIFDKHSELLMSDSFKGCEVVPHCWTVRQRS